MFHLYRCKDCNEVFAFTVFDHSPQYQYLPEKGLYREENLDERAALTAKHDGHHLEKLRFIKGTMISERDYREPVKEVYFEATNGRKRFVIKKWRKNVNEPMEYELIHGSLKIIVYSCEVREGEIKKEWLRVMPEPLMEKAVIFLTILKETATEMKAGKGTRMIFETLNPLMFYQGLSQRCIKMVLKRLRNTVTPLELKEIRTFIHEQNQADGVIPLMIKKKFFIEKAEEKEVQPEESAACMPSKIKPIPVRIRPVEYQI
jgi:hypothetical protein